MRLLLLRVCAITHIKRRRIRHCIRRRHREQPGSETVFFFEKSAFSVYCHGLDVAGNRELPALGATRASLFISDNGGDDRECVSAHLPPVYAARFVPDDG
jgi:hypothetical protein